MYIDDAYFCFYDNKVVYSETGWRAKFQSFLTRKRRPLTKDDFLAILSWAFVGHGAFILIGTTTFASVVLLLANSLQIEELVARKIGKYLTKATGVVVTFGSAQPNWKDGNISFKDVHVVCGPPTAVQPGNYTRYDLTIESFDVNISLARMLEGKGLAKTCSVNGVRGLIDRSHLISNPGWKYQHQPGDFDLEGVHLKDVLVNITNPGDFRPFSVSILSAELPRLRKQFLLYDILCVHSAVGMYDKCLFSIHTPQIEITEDGKRKRTNYSKLRHLKIDGLNVDHFNAGATTGPLSWLQRGTVDIDAFVQLPANYREPSEDGLGAALDNIRENILLGILQKKSGALSIELPSMLRSGNGMIEKDPVSLKLSEFKERLRDIRLGYLSPTIERLRRRWTRDVMNVDDVELETPEETTAFFMHAKPDTLAFKFDLRFRNIRAHVPLRNEDMSTINAALIRPIVAYINEHRPYVPISCRFELDLAKFDGAWSIYDSGISSGLADGVTDALSKIVTDKNKRLKRLRKVGLWSIYSVVKNMGPGIRRLAQIIVAKKPSIEHDEDIKSFEVQIERQLNTYRLLMKEIKGYPKTLQKSMRLQRDMIEFLKDTMQKAHMTDPSPMLGEVQRTYVALLEFEHKETPFIDIWLKNSGILADMEDLQKFFHAMRGKLDRRLARLSKIQQTKDELKQKTLIEEYEEANELLKAELPLFLDLSQKVMEECEAKLLQFQQETLSKWQSAFAVNLRNGMTGNLRRKLEEAIHLMAPTVFPLTKVAELSIPASPTDVPTSTIITTDEPPVEVKKGQSTSVLYPVRRPPSNSIAALTKAFDEVGQELDEVEEEQLEVIKSSDKLHFLQELPPLPSGESRVAALAAQLEASKIIFRPMGPAMRKPVKKYPDAGKDEEDEEEYERNLGSRNPYSKNAITMIMPWQRARTKTKQPIPPKPPKKNYVWARYDFEALQEGDLSFRKGDKIMVMVKTDRLEDWWTGRIGERVGVFPANYCCTQL